MTMSAPEQQTWLVKAASVAGGGHRRAGRACQDAHCWRRLPGGWLVAAVADGAGSARLAERGAVAAARFAAQWLAEQAHRFPPPGQETRWRALLLEALENARLAVEAEAAELAASISDLATTLALLVASPRQLAAIQIGDGAIVNSDAEGRLLALTVPRRGEYCNETFFLHSAGALERAQIRVWTGAPDCLAMMTDGVQALALNQPGSLPHGPFFEPLWHFARQPLPAAEGDARLRAFLESDRLAARVDDDLTLLLASLNPAAA